LGGCERIQLSPDIAAGAATGGGAAELSTPNVVNHPVSDQHPLIDFKYQGKDGVFRALQAIIGEGPKASRREIDDLHRAVEEDRSLRLYHLVRAERSQNLLRIRSCLCRFMRRQLKPVCFGCILSWCRIQHSRTLECSKN
jgi:hypothetical protein